METANDEKNHQKRIVAILAQPVLSDWQAASCKRPMELCVLAAKSNSDAATPMLFAGS